jgi:hypothetical protein
LVRGAHRPFRGCASYRLEGPTGFRAAAYTGQRRSDVVKIGRQHIYNDVLAVDQAKTEGGEEAHLEIPVHPKLRDIIDEPPRVWAAF